MFFFHVSEREYDTYPEQVYRKCYVRLRACVVPFFFALRSGVRFVHEHDDTFHRHYFGNFGRECRYGRFFRAAHKACAAVLFFQLLSQPVEKFVAALESAFSGAVDAACHKSVYERRMDVEFASGARKVIHVRTENGWLHIQCFMLVCV